MHTGCLAHSCSRAFPWPVVSTWTYSINSPASAPTPPPLSSWPSPPCPLPWSLLSPCHHCHFTSLGISSNRGTLHGQGQSEVPLRVAHSHTAAQTALTSPSGEKPKARAPLRTSQSPQQLSHCTCRCSSPRTRSLIGPARGPFLLAEEGLGTTKHASSPRPGSRRVIHLASHPRPWGLALCQAPADFNTRLFNYTDDGCHSTLPTVTTENTQTLPSHPLQQPCTHSSFPSHAGTGHLLWAMHHSGPREPKAEATQSRPLPLWG